MSLRPKTKIRLVLILGVCAVIGGVLSWVRRSQVARESQHIETLRRDGMDAYARHDYATALAQLNDYIVSSKTGQDEADDNALDALYAFADCRGRIRIDSRGRHIAEARERLERYRLARPDDDKARRLMMSFDARTFRHKDVVQTADQLLAKNPNDVEALLAKATALAMLQPKPDLGQARQTLDRLLALDANHLRGRLLELQLLLAGGASSDEVIAQAAKMRISHPGNPVFDLIFARSCVVLSRAKPANGDEAGKWAGWLKEARNAALSAAKAPPPDSDFAEQLTYTLEKTHAFPQAIDYARSAVDNLGPAAGEELPRGLARRLWQAGRYDQVLDRTAKLQSRSPLPDTDTLAYRALSILGLLNRANGTDAARLSNDLDAVTAGLALRTLDLDAQAWVLVLQADRKLLQNQSRGGLPANPPVAPAEIIGLYRQALEKDPQNLVASAHLADVLALIGETESAKRAWQSASRQWEWAYPLARRSAIALQEGQLADARQLAADAVERQPTERDYALLLVRADYIALGASKPLTAPSANLTPGPVDKELLDRVRSLVKTWPADPDLLPIEVTLIARVQGREAATARMKQILSANPPVPSSALSSLWSVNGSEGLGLSSDLEAALARLPDGPRQLAVQQAFDRLTHGQPAEGFKLLQDAQTKLKLGSDPTWLLTVAAFRDRAEDPDVQTTLATVADQAPQDIGLQLQILATSGVRRDRELWRRTIDRVRTLCGDDTSRWKSERAQWLLSGNASPADRKEAIHLLTQVVKQNADSADAHRLLGKALAADRQFDRAGGELVSALKQFPGHPTITLELVDALRLAHKPGDALAQLATLSPEQLPVEHALRAAQLYEWLGRIDRSIDLLQRQPPSGPIDAKLARLYRLGGKLADADKAYRRTLNAENVTAFDLASGAEFFASRQQMDFARLFLDRLRATSPSPAVAELLLGQFEGSFGTTELATEHLKRATELEPKSAGNWRALTGHLLRAGQLDEADRAADTGLKAASASTDLAAMKTVIRLARRIADPTHNLFVRLLSFEPQNEAAQAVLAVLADTHDSLSAAKTDRAAQATALALQDQKLSELAERYKDFWILQQEMIGRCLASGRPEAAGALATRAMSAFPSLAEPAALAGYAYQRCGRWAAAIEAAQAWRARSEADPLPADVLLAELQLSQRRGDLKVVDRLAALVADHPLPQSGPGATQPAVVSSTLVQLHGVYAQALVEAGRPDEAFNSAEALLHQGDAGIAAWLGVSSAFRDPALARRWIDRAATHASAGSDVDPLTIALAKAQAAEATGDSSLLAESANLLDGLLTKSPQSIEVLSARAMVAHQQRDYDRAILSWRALRSLSPASTPDVANNLAYALIMKGDLKAGPEAFALAEEATKASPDSSTYLCTLAKAQSWAGDKPAAIATYRKALSKDSDAIEALVGLADELFQGARLADRPQVRDLVSRARQLMDSGQTVSAETRLVLDSLQSASNSPDAKMPQ